MTKQYIIATHNGAFHADDVVGVGILAALFDVSDILRTRDAALIAKADFAVDVGGVWDPKTGRFDHHQKGFEGQRDNGTVYASAGLVWAAHGKAYICKLAPELSDDLVMKVFEGIDREFMEHVDRADTGAAQGAPDFFGISALIASFNITRQEEQSHHQAYGGRPDTNKVLSENFRMDRFTEATRVVQRLLARLVAQFSAQYADEAIVRNAPRLEGGKVLLVEHAGLVWEGVVIQEMPEVLFVVYPDSTDQQFQVRTVPVKVGSFTARKDLPASWAGLRDADLAAVTGVEDAVFCHNGRFIGGAGSKNGALRMAQLAL